MSPESIRLPTLWAMLAICLLATGSYAQEQPEQQSDPPQESTEPAGPDDALGRGTPRQSVRGFVAATANGDFEAAAEYLDLRNLPRGLGPEDGPRLARLLDIVLERKLVWIDIDGLSDRPDGLAGDGLPGYRDELGRIETKDGEVVLLLQHVPRGDGEFIWKVSNVTVAQIPALYDEFGYWPIAEWLAEALPDVSILGLALFKWVIILGAGLLAYPLLKLLTSGLSRLVGKRGSPMHDRVTTFFTRPVMWLLMVLFLFWVILSLGIDVEAQKIARAGTLVTIAIVWVVLAGINLSRDLYSQRMRRRGQVTGEVLLRPIANATKIVLVLIAILVWLDNAGFNITALLAGLGVGGLAIALALQKPLEDLFGAVSLYSQQPVRVGDFCRFGTMTGTVEEIGLRTSRIRTLANTLVSVPNARLAAEYIENYSARQKFWYHPKLQLRYDTSPDQLRYLLVEIRRMLYSHAKMESETARVRFIGFGEHSLDLQVYAYIETREFTDYLEVSEDLNLRIIDIVAEAGSGFAYPTQTLQLERGSGADVDRAQAAEDHVRQWRESDDLYLPGFPQEKVDELAGSIPYPPPGSPKEKD